MIKTTKKVGIFGNHDYLRLIAMWTFTIIHVCMCPSHLELGTQNYIFHNYEDRYINIAKNTN